MLSEISKTEKQKHCLISLICGILKKRQTINTGEGVEKREPSCIVGGNVN